MSSDEDKDAPFMSRPLCVYRGHVSDVLDVSWSKVIVISIISYKISFIWIAELGFCDTIVLKKWREKTHLIINAS